MQLAHRWISRDLSRLELVVSILLISILIGFFAKYALTVFASVEKKMIERTVINIETALNYHAAIAVFNQDNISLNKLLNENPIELISSQRAINQLNKINAIAHEFIASSIVSPDNYAGIVLNDNSQDLETGMWYYDSDDNFLFYTVRNDEFFDTDLPGLSRLRFKMVIDYTDVDGNQEYDMLKDMFLSIKLIELDQTSWAI